MNKDCQEDRSVFLVTHEIFDIDKYCFPGQLDSAFFEISKWPPGIAKIFEEVGELVAKNRMRLIRGEVRENEELTYIWVEAKNKEDIFTFYDQFEFKLKSLGHKYNFDTLRIIPDSCKECSDTLIGRDMMRELDSMKKIVS